MLDLKDFGLFRTAALRSFSIVWNSAQLLYQTSDTERSRRRWDASIKVDKKGGHRYTYTGSFSYAHGLSPPRNSILSGVSITTTISIHSSDTNPWTGPKGVASQTQHQLGAYSEHDWITVDDADHGFRSEGLVPVNAPTEDASRTPVGTYPARRKSRGRPRSARGNTLIKPAFCTITFEKHRTRASTFVRGV